MRALGAILAVAVVLAGCGPSDDDGSSSPQPLTVMTFNVLCSFCDRRNYDPWEERLPYFGDIFARHDPDLIGLQELTPLGNEVEQILAQAPGFEAIYFAPENELPYPDALILYRSTRFTVIESGSYWLSPTPDMPLSTGFAPPQFPRLVVWARLLDGAAGREIYFATTHFDNNSPSQERSAPLVRERTLPFVEDRPVIVVGDFNSRPNSTAYEMLTDDSTDDFGFQDSFDLAEWHLVANQQPLPAYDITDRIDHIFLAGRGVTWVVNDWAADLTIYGPNQRYPSDHFPIIAQVAYRAAS
jgi:endonuclease/exonuclease/phosphatase family metal-dependent hydrolase